MSAKAGLPVLEFANAQAWEEWLDHRPNDDPGLWLKLAKKGNDRSTLTKAEAIDGALIHGWIDGQLDSHDDDWFLVRFTPRRARSKWSQKNRDRAVELIDLGRMRPRGTAAVDAAKADGRWDAAYAPQSSATVPDDLAAELEKAPGARAFFDRLDSANRFAILYRVGEARKAQSRAVRIAKFAAMCAREETIHRPRQKK